jgi:hypothetical protein
MKAMHEHLSQSTLSRMLAEAGKQVTVGAQYIHYKDKPYKVIDLAVLESTNEVCVIYQAQYGKQLTFIRPVSGWLQKVEKDGKFVARFTKAGA